MALDSPSQAQNSRYCGGFKNPIFVVKSLNFEIVAGLCLLSNPYKKAAIDKKIFFVSSDTLENLS